MYYLVTILKIIKGGKNWKRGKKPQTNKVGSLAKFVGKEVTRVNWSKKKKNWPRKKKEGKKKRKNISLCS